MGNDERGPWPDRHDLNRCPMILHGGLIEPAKQCVLDNGHEAAGTWHPISC